MSKYTPGPWKAEDNSWEVSTVYSATGDQVAKCHIDANTEEDTQDIFEPIKDTWLDIVGYSVIAIMWINDWFLLELKKDSTSKKITKETK